MSKRTQQKIIEVCETIAGMLIAKNQSYGDSAVHPCRVFSHVDNIEQINVRIDDKLNRMMNGHEYPGDNDEMDLIGYLILKQVAKEINSEDNAKAESDFNNPTCTYNETGCGDCREEIKACDSDAGLSNDRSRSKLMDGRRSDNVLEGRPFTLRTPRGEGFRKPDYLQTKLGTTNCGCEDSNEYCVDSVVKARQGDCCCKCEEEDPFGPVDL